MPFPLKTEMGPPAAAQLLREELAEHAQAFEALRAMIEGPFLAGLDLLEHSLRSGGKLLLFGNGGSAADAQHIAAELTIRYKTDRAPIAAIALTTDTSALTACGNDLGFDAIFARQVEALARPGDVVIGISTSGNSANVLAGLSAARARDARTIGLAGGTGGKMVSLCDVLVTVPSAVTARIQELHILIGHMWCKALEQRLGLA
ncbi:MAG TPA: D-sedoheptulose 7-phosphate isomerase [Steroidobacteraceae bacterium]|nr:D-sedoheptulose 7-phosphate isomerase [Steroidobacteraceae bacterium]